MSEIPTMEELEQAANSLATIALPTLIKWINMEQQSGRWGMPDHVSREVQHDLRLGIVALKQFTAALARAEELAGEVERLKTRLLSAAGDDLCRLTQDEIKAMSAGAVQIPPKEEFLASCERFHAQVAGEAGVLGNCLTLAQLIAENETLKARAEAAERELEELRPGIKWRDKDGKLWPGIAPAAEGGGE